MKFHSGEELLGWERPRGRRLGSLAGFLPVERSGSCSVPNGGARSNRLSPNRQRRRPPTRKPRPVGKTGGLDLRRDSLVQQYWAVPIEGAFGAREEELLDSSTLEDSKPLTPAEEARCFTRSSSSPAINASGILKSSTSASLANVHMRLQDSLPSESIAARTRHTKPRPPRLVDDEAIGTPSPLASPAGSLAQAGASVVNDIEGRRSGKGTPTSGKGTPTGISWATSECQGCAKLLRFTDFSETNDARLCNACQAKHELKALSSPRQPADGFCHVRGVGRLADSCELIDLAGSKFTGSK